MVFLHCDVLERSIVMRTDTWSPLLAGTPWGEGRNLLCGWKWILPFSKPPRAESVVTGEYWVTWVLWAPSLSWRCLGWISKFCQELFATHVSGSTSFSYPPAPSSCETFLTWPVHVPQSSTCVNWVTLGQDLKRISINISCMWGALVLCIFWFSGPGVRPVFPPF